MVDYSFVIPVYNEEAVVPLLLHRLDGLLLALDGPAEVIFVDDGSTDTTGIVLAARAAADPRFRYVALSRNFGHQTAVTAGLDRARGKATIVMDADLQDPPELVHEMIAKWREGFDIVYAQRIERDGETAFKRLTAAVYYRLLERLTVVRIPRNVGDFRLVDRRVLDVVIAMREHDRFLRGMFGWVGFRQAAVPFRRQARAAGSTKYPLRKMLRLAKDGIVGFSDAPLRMALWLGVVVSSIAALFGLFVVGLALSGSPMADGWASTVVIVSFLSGMNLLMTGIVGLYVGRIHAEVKGRPLYVVARDVGAPEAGTVPLPAPVPLPVRRAGS